MDNFYFFYNGFLSQWYRVKFSINGIEYNCAEQWMMAEKARLFKDAETEKKIMETDHPRDQKALGRTVQGFDKDLWESIAKEVVYRGNIAKFSQNPKLLNRLRQTGDSELVEASPTDRIWGIGLGLDHPDLNDKSKWQGTNWLGECIMRVRNELCK